MLANSGPIAASVFIFFVTLVTLSIWNIIGSMFVERIMLIAEPSPREKMVADLINSQMETADIQKFFLAFDSEKLGILTERQFDDLISEGGLLEFMAERDVVLKDAFDVSAFFHIAAHQDRERGLSSKTPPDRSRNEVSIEALVATSFKLKGNAKSFDLAAFRLEVDQKFEQQQKSLAAVLRRL